MPFIGTKKKVFKRFTCAFDGVGQRAVIALGILMRIIRGLCKDKIKILKVVCGMANKNKLSIYLIKRGITSVNDIFDSPDKIQDISKIF